MVDADGGQQIRSGRSVAWWLLEAESAGWCVGLDGVTHLVDYHMVVEPTECGEVGWVCSTAL